MGHKIFGPDRSLCCKGTLESNITKNEETCSGDVSSVCSLKPIVQKNQTGQNLYNQDKRAGEINTCKLPVKKIMQCNSWFGPIDATTKYEGVLDTLFFSMYACGLYFSGYIVDRLDLRTTLSVGMAASALVTCAFGILGFLNIHSFWLYAFVWAINGLIQSIGWPSTVAVMGLWFGNLHLSKNVILKRGAVIGAWASNASAGNIVGALLVTYMLSSVKAVGYIEGSNGDWRICMISAGLFLFICAALNFAFLRLPKEVSFHSAMEIEKQAMANESLQNIPSDFDRLALAESEDDQLIPLNNEHGVSIDNQDVDDLSSDNTSIGFLEALLIPGVIPYSISYLCLKMANYAMFFWLPFYLSHTIYQGKSDSSGKANDLSTLYDIGQILGGIVGGYLSDRLKARSPVIVFMLIPSIGIFFFSLVGQRLGC